jgi:hypothetical protein
LARQLIASLDDTVDADAETQWHDVMTGAHARSRKAKSVAVRWSRETSATSSVRVVSHPEADEELEAAAL